jgi:uncharacterized LabA/DUF88 family protein
MTLRTYVYVDGFNLYYGCLRGTPYRWLDLEKLARHLLPPRKHEIRWIKYYTARISARPSDPQQPTRQQTYLRALGTLPRVKIFYGHYLAHVVRMPLAFPRPGGPTHVEVIKTEEKGSDVNLATHLVADAFEGRFDVAVLVTNDSDLQEPVRYVRAELHKVVGILNPHPVPAAALQRVASFTKQIRKGVLEASQLPAEIKDSVGTITKPAGW